MVSGLTNHNLVSVVKLCRAGCQAAFKDTGCKITHRGKTVVCGSMCKKTGLWMTPILNTAVN